MITLLQLTPYTGDVAEPSPNHDVRKAMSIEGIVLHATADQGEEELSLSWMRSPESRVSCHLWVSRRGRVVRLVGDRQRAWHAGESWWRGTSDVNSITLGIEIANRNDGEAYTDAQYERVAEIVTHYCRLGLSLADVVSHAEIAKGRKTDPVGWDWDRLRGMVEYRVWITGEESLRVPPVRAPIPAKRNVPNVAPAVPAVVVSAKAPTIASSKHVLQSRTIWLNALLALAAGGMLSSDTLDVAQRIGLRLPDIVTKWAILIIGIVNIILRLRTSRPLRCSRDGICSPPPAAPPLPEVRPAAPRPAIEEAVVSARARRASFPA